MSNYHAAITIEMGPHISVQSAEHLAHRISRMIANEYPDVINVRVWEVWNPDTETVTPLPQNPAAYYAEIDAEEE